MHPWAGLADVFHKQVPHLPPPLWHQKEFNMTTTQACMKIRGLMFSYLPYHPPSTYEISILHSQPSSTTQGVAGIVLTTPTTFNLFLIPNFIHADYSAPLSLAMKHFY